MFGQTALVMKLFSTLHVPAAVSAGHHGVMYGGQSELTEEIVPYPTVHVLLTVKILRIESSQTGMRRKIISLKKEHDKFVDILVQEHLLQGIRKPVLCYDQCVL
jgi:hypothetical protein